MGLRAFDRAGVRNLAASAAEERDCLELILSSAIGTSSESVERLLVEFGSVAATLSATRERLAPFVDERAAEIICCVKQLCSTLLRSEIEQADVADTPAAIARYFKSLLAHRHVEEVHVAYLDVGSRVIRSELIGRGSLTTAPLSPREIVRRGLELAATSVIVVHNHPSGDPLPSQADIRMTRTLVEAGRLLGLDVVDHIVVARRGWTSMRAEGLM